MCKNTRMVCFPKPSLASSCNIPATAARHCLQPYDCYGNSFRATGLARTHEHKCMLLPEQPELCLWTGNLSNEEKGPKGPGAKTQAVLDATLPGQHCVSPCVRGVLDRHLLSCQALPNQL